MSDSESPGQKDPTDNGSECEAAKIIGVTRRTLSEWARTGILRPASVTPTGRYFWDPDELRRQFRERQREQD